MKLGPKEQVIHHVGWAKDGEEVVAWGDYGPEPEYEAPCKKALGVDRLHWGVRQEGPVCRRCGDRPKVPIWRHNDSRCPEGRCPGWGKEQAKWIYCPWCAAQRGPWAKEHRGWHKSGEPPCYDPDCKRGHSEGK